MIEQDCNQVPFVIYIGKEKALRTRLQSYPITIETFDFGTQQDDKTREIKQLIFIIQFIMNL